jgi:nitrate/TMAO reductase-like tetraheme cytochrome c subunit
VDEVGREGGMELTDPGTAGDPPAEPEPATPAGDPPLPAGKPHRRRRRWIIGLSIAGALIVILIIASFVTAHYTSASPFCVSCHEMDPYNTSWQDSTHASPAAECRDCHIPPGSVSYVETKLFSFREIWVHLTEHTGEGHSEPPLAVTREIPNSSCFRCHETPADTTLGNVPFSHEAHADKSCIDCHVRLVHRGVPPLAYRDPAAMSSCLTCHDGSTAPGQCSYCHTPPHQPRGECSSCHSLTSWGSAGSGHPFPREGAHAGLDCTDCHVSKPGVEIIPGTTVAQADPACISCHADQHGGLTDCASCHTPTSWSDVTFEHPFPIDGGHADLTCADCHESKPGVTNIPGTQFPAANPACNSCHADQHGGLTDCASCHTPTSWSDVNFTHPFKLTGAHASLSCANCHGTPFKEVGSTCVSCHGTQHGGLTDCARCHTTKAWEPSTFRHPSVREHGASSFACVRCHPNGYATASCTCHGGNPPTDD